MQGQNNSEAKKSGAPVRRRVRRWLAICLRLLLYPLLLVAVAVTGLFVFLQSDAGQETIQRATINALEKIFPIHVQIEKITWDLLSGFSIRGVRLFGDEGLILEADQISAGYAGPLLLKKTLFIHHITFNGCRINLVQDAGGAWNIESLFKGGGKDPSDRKGTMGFDVVIGRISVDRSHIILTKEGRIRHFRNVGFHAYPRFEPFVEVKIDGFTFQTDTPNFHLTNLNGSIHYDPWQKKILFDNLFASTKESKIKVDGSIATKTPEPEFHLSVQILALSTAEAAKWASIEWMRPASIMGSIEINGTPGSFDHRSILRMAALSIQSQGQLRVTPNSGVSISGSASLRNLNLSELPLSLPPEIIGTVNADIVVNGENLTTMHRKITADIDMRASRLFGIEIKDARMALVYEHEQDRLTLEQGRLNASLGSFDISGVLEGLLPPNRQKSLSVKLSSKKFNPEVLAGSKKITGEVNFDLAADARTTDLSNHDELSASVSLRIHPSKLGGIALDSGWLHARYADRRIWFEQTEVFTEFGRMAWNGYVAPVHRDCRLHLSLQTGLPAATSVLSRYISGPRATDPLTGHLSLDVLLAGWYDNPVLTVTLQGTDLHYGRFASKHLALTGNWQGLPTSFSSAFDLLMDNFRFGEIAFLNIQIKGGLSHERVSVEIRGAFENEERLLLSADIEKWLEPQKFVKIHTADFAYNGLTLRAAEPIRLTVSPGEVSLNAFRLISEQAEFSATGSIARTGSQNIFLSLKNFEINRLSEFFPAMRHIHGELSLQTVLKGTLTNPVIEASVSVEDFALTQYSFSRLVLTGLYAGSTLSFRNAVFVENNRVLESSGQVSARLSFMPSAFEMLPETLEADVVIQEVHLSRLPLPAVKRVKYDGIITGKASIRSDGKIPVFDGELSLKKGAVSFSRPDLSYEEVYGNIRFSRNTVRLEKFEAKGDREGKLNLSGTLTVDGMNTSSFDFRLKGKNVYLPYEKAIYAIIEPDMRLSGNFASPVLTGKIFVTEAQADLDRWAEREPSEIQIIDSKNHDAERFYLPEKETEGLPFFSPVAADVTITIPNNAWIKGQGLDAEIRGKINLKKVPQKSFVLLGSLNAVRGLYVLQGKRFKITEGSVSFLGLEETNPNLDITGVYRIKNIDILARVTGTAKNLTLSLNSDPVMDQADIISYLVFGQPTDGLNSQKAFDAEKAALNMTGALTEAKLDEFFKKYLDVDTFSIEMEEGDVNRSYASIGKYIAPNVFVLYRQGFSFEAGQQIIVSYELSSRFSLEALIGDEKQSGVDLIWKYDY